MKVYDRFYSKFLVHPVTRCWIWTDCRISNGYAGIWVSGKSHKAHRLSWELHIGPIPESLHVLHKCDNRLCVRPEHLYIGTNDDNIADKVARGRERYLRGADLPCAKITEDDVKEIRSIKGKTLQQIGDIYGLELSTIGKIRSRRLWKHVE
jgi:hypothetical protein